MFEQGKGNGFYISLHLFIIDDVLFAVNQRCHVETTYTLASLLQSPRYKPILFTVCPGGVFWQQTIKLNKELGKHQPSLVSAAAALLH